MVFSSISFLAFFLPLVLLLYYSIPSITYRNGLLLAASLLFYAWGEPKYVLLMASSILFNYNMGIKIASVPSAKKLILCFAILVNLGILFVFKYMGFSCRILTFLLESIHAKPLQAINVIMPIGISFYTFQSISYLADVYRAPELVQNDVLKLGLYISFFPQLIAGPIVRYHEINAQIECRTHSAEQFSQGLERFIVGLSKKTLIANQLAKTCDSIYGADFFSYGTALSWAACIAYALQIYYDFSGYSDMAIGLAKLFGFSLPENFNYPYAATSITDFWKRWHISLTNWFRDYVYIPLGGNRKGTKRTIANRFIVFFTTGLWHGASFNFILWGLCHGMLMTIERMFKKKRNTGFIISAIKRIYTIAAVSFLWILFRNGTKQSVKILLKLFGINYTSLTAQYIPFTENEMLFFYADTKFFILAAIGILFSFPWHRKLGGLSFAKTSLFLAAKYICLICLFVLCFASLAANSYNPFIYFRF